MSKEFTIENEYLKLTVTTWGAQVKSLVRKCDGVEHIWNADSSVWNPGQIPPCGVSVLFPWEYFTTRMLKSQGLCGFIPLWAGASAG